MQAYLPPRSDHARKNTMRQVIRTALSDQGQGLVYLSPTTLAAFQALLPSFEDALEAVTFRRASYAQVTGEAEAALARLKTYLRDLWEGMRRRVKRNGEPENVLWYYALPQNGATPRPGLQGDWLVLADRIIVGDAQAVAAGYPPAVCPSVEEIQLVLTDARAKIAAISSVERAYDDAQAALAALRTQADALIRDGVDELRFALRKREAPDRRRIMRTYGFVFSSQQDTASQAQEPV